MAKSVSVENIPNVPPLPINFTEFGLNENLMAAITEVGFVEPSEIQKQAIPLVMHGQDIIGQAKTGSGKTASFALPAIDRLQFNKTVEVLVLVPTRELAQQVEQEFVRLGQFTPAKVVTVIGGQSGFRQIELINRGCQVVIATPGRLLDHLESKKLKRFQPTMVVLDEADEMLDMGFIEDIEKIMTYLPETRQTLLFSATMPPAIVKLSKKILKDPSEVRLTSGACPNVDVSQTLYVVNSGEREAALVRLIEYEDPYKAIVFCRRRADVDALATELTKKKIRVRTLHGDLAQSERTRAINDIKSGVVHVLIATDVASRGIDISDLSHVFNYHVPDNKERYIHRIGRTGRAGRKGHSITIATPGELKHPFFRGYKMENFELRQVPSKAQLERKVRGQLIDQINSARIDNEAEVIFDRVQQEGNTRQFFCQMYSLLQSNNAVSGEDKIGYRPKDVVEMAKNRSQGKRGFRKKSSSGQKNGRPPKKGRRRR
ncbi:MAG: DEAD/DEAH box helicase [Bdellovibrionales bacterium]|nr:DEAD/DEAH box helicase [Bdellovibrionales bacterium]